MERHLFDRDLGSFLIEFNPFLLLSIYWNKSVSWLILFFIFVSFIWNAATIVLPFCCFCQKVGSTKYLKCFKMENACRCKKKYSLSWNSFVPCQRKFKKTCEPMYCASSSWWLRKLHLSPWNKSYFMASYFPDNALNILGIPHYKVPCVLHKWRVESIYRKMCSQTRTRIVTNRLQGECSTGFLTQYLP